MYTYTLTGHRYTHMYYCGGRRWTCGACSSSVPRQWRQRHPTKTFFTRSVDIYIIYLYYYTRTRHKNRVSCPFIIRSRACVEVCAYNNRKIVMIDVAIYYYIMNVTYQNRYNIDFHANKSVIIVILWYIDCNTARTCVPTFFSGWQLARVFGRRTEKNVYKLADDYCSINVI